VRGEVTLHGLNSGVVVVAEPAEGHEAALVRVSLAAHPDR
jgi:hypothetical protein